VSEPSPPAVPGTWSLRRVGSVAWLVVKIALLVLAMNSLESTFLYQNF
jgi:hypothetical protein